MAHQRKTIREAVVELLKLEVPEVEGRVSETRITQIFGSEKLPSISVYTLGEESESHGVKPLVLQRTMALAIEFLIKSSEDLDDKVDELCLKIERAMAKDVRLNGTCEECSLTATEIEHDDSSKSKIGAARLSFDVIYISEF